MKTIQTTDNIDRLARRRAGAKLGWYIHALAYVCVNLMLAAISQVSGKHWAVFPALGWGLGLAIHGMVVFVTTGGAGLYDKLVERERQRLGVQNDAW